MTRPGIDRILVPLLSLTALVLLVLQGQSLYVSPIHDSYLWWGDETWLMLEYRTQMSEGVFRHPYAFGSSLIQGNPFLLSSMWLTSLVYGGAALLTDLPIVNAGRTITFVVSILLAIAVYAIAARRYGASAGLVGVMLLISARTFFLTSHSARYDTLTAAYIVLFIYYLSEAAREKNRDRLIVMSALLPLGLLISVHTIILVTLPFVLAVLLQRRQLDLKSGIAIVLLPTAVVLTLYAIYFVSQPSISGVSTAANNLYTLPILRPFSRSVQLANLEQKAELLCHFATIAIPLIVLSAIGATRGIVLSLLALAVFGSWLFVEAAGPSSYLIYILPVLIIGSVPLLNQWMARSASAIVVGLVAVGVAIVGMSDARQAHMNGEILTQELRGAISNLNLSKDSRVLAMNPAVSHLLDMKVPLSTAHAIELPSSTAPYDSIGHVITFNSALQPGFIWEVMPLRTLVAPDATRITGRFLDVGRSYFDPMTESRDTLFYSTLDQRTR